MLAPPELEKVHPLGKAPLLGITPAGKEDEMVLAESGFIAQYLCEHFGKGMRLVPERWEGAEGQGDDGMGKVGGETEEWMRWMYYLHYVEGSLMPPLGVGLVISSMSLLLSPVALPVLFPLCSSSSLL